MFITRKQYDILISDYAGFMKNDYDKLTRAWSLGGVTVAAKNKRGDLIIVNLKDILKTIDAK